MSPSTQSASVPKNAIKTIKNKSSLLHKLAELKLPPILLVVIAFLAGLMFSFSLAPYHFWILAIISPAILYALLLAKITNKQAFIIGEAYGTGLWLSGAYWLYVSIHSYGNTHMLLAGLAVLAMALLMGLFHGVLAVLFNRFLGKQPFAFASIWVLQEWLKTWVLTGFPWLFVGYAFTEKYWLSAYAPIFGVFAISFIAVLFSASVVETIKGKAKFLIPSVILLLIGVGLWQADPQWTTAKKENKLKVSLLQGNIPQSEKWLTEKANETLAIYAQLSNTEWEQDVIIWPESSIPMFQTQAWSFITQFAERAYLTKTTWITGIPFKEADAKDAKSDPIFYNSLVALGANANGLYKKQKLVPFGEYIPFSGVLDLFPNLAGSEKVQNYSAGTKQQKPLQVQGHNVGSAICYEVAYPVTTRQNAKNSDFLLTVSNDAWFDDSSAPWQHLQMVQMRSLETGRWFLRATNTGVTAIIDEKGQIVKKAPQFERTVLRGEVEARTGETPFMKMGQAPILIVASLLLLLSILGERARVREILGKDEKSSTDIKQINQQLEKTKEKK
ncbi:MAG: apolipoprotein N-acyltransferase [Moraxellaceae bacterium]|nr:apolipoprotein N-acyltransferase [Moraxellaceae bacterium]